MLQKPLANKNKPEKGKGRGKEVEEKIDKLINYFQEYEMMVTNQLFSWLIT